VAQLHHDFQMVVVRKGWPYWIQRWQEETQKEAEAIRLHARILKSWIATTHAKYPQYTEVPLDQIFHKLVEHDGLESLEDQYQSCGQ
jgi:hypothetical protein